MRTRLGDRWEATLLGLPRGEDPEIGGALDLMARAGPQGSIVDGRLFALLTCSIIDLTLTHGVYAASVWALTAYGYQLSSKGGHADADRLFDLALELADRHGFVAHRPAICTILSTRIWTRPLRAAVETAREGVRLGIEHGDVHNAAICSVLVCLDRLAAGEPLADIERDAEEGLEVARRVRLAGEAGNLVVIRQLVRALRGRTDGLSAFTGPGFDQRALEETLTANEPVGLSLWFYIYQLQAQVLAGEYTAALETRPRAQSLPEFMRGFPLAIAAELFGALAIAGSERDEREAHLRELRESAGRFAHWAELSHENFAHGHALLAGELARAEGRGSEALERFGVAAARAQASGFIHVEALAHESAARTCRELGRLGAAERHVHQAIECYRQWGAEGVAARLEQTLSGASSAGGAELVDALAVARAAQTIAREAQLERLIERLLETAIMQAGARGGALLLRRGDATVVAASAERTGDGVAVTIYAPPREPSAVLVAETVVNYVTRTKQPLILSDAASAEVFGSDPYILRRGVRSMLCVPMLARGELRGLLCVENDLIAGAFTSERLGALELITAQAVISLENAQARDHLRAMAARIVTAGDEARRRIERNLHDGTQQQLLVLGLDLQTLDTIIPAEAREAHAELARIRADAAAILDQVREISRGLHPAVLTHGGLGPALAALARASPIPVRLAVDCDVRLPAPVEICTYYVVSESLANAAKHSGAEVVTIDVRVADELLHAVVTDDGRGGADERSGSGITGLSDRVEALGGRLAISSPRGRGTRVAIELPIQPAD
jgi:signal transduction histidine kinase